MDNPFEEINKIIENLQLITKNNSSFTQIEKDIILQKLREAYLVFMNYDTNPEDITTPVTVVSVEKKEVFEEAAKQSEKFSDIIFNPDSKQVIINEPLSKIENKTEELSNKEEVSFKELESEFETMPLEKDEEISPETDLGNDDILEFLPDKSSKNENFIIEKEDDIPVSAEPFKNEFIKEEDIEEVMQPFVEDEPLIDNINKEESDFSRQYNPKQDIPKKVFNSLFDEIPETENVAQKRSLNDILIEQKKDNSLNTKYQNTKISDLTKSISINDKFLFIRELFKNREKNSVRQYKH